MIEPKALIYSKLSELTTPFPDLAVYQDRPEVLEEAQVLTFRIQSNVPEYDLGFEIAIQDITVAVDIWANTSIETGQILIATESKMKEIGYRLGFATDVPDPDLKSHITTQFIY